ncbi:DNA repair protein RecO [Pseudomonadota bacterium]
MKWSDEAIILATRKHGETSLIVKLLSKNNGLYAGFVKGALSKKKTRGIYEVGNLVEAEWKSRVEEHLGTFKIELKESFWYHAINNNIKLMALNSAISLIFQNIQERQPENNLFAELLDLLKAIKNEENSHNFLAKYVFFEIAFLSNMGYGLSLDKCGVTQSEENLAFLSPKTGRAISEEVGNPYRDKLFKLPRFMSRGFDQDREIYDYEILNGLNLTGYFINKYFYSNDNKRKNPIRDLFVQLVQSKLSMEVV